VTRRRAGGIAELFGLVTVHSSCAIDAPSCTRIVLNAVDTTSPSSTTTIDARTRRCSDVKLGWVR
jgi:hypothetical protein